MEVVLLLIVQWVCNSLMGGDVTLLQLACTNHYCVYIFHKGNRGTTLLVLNNILALRVLPWAFDLPRPSLATKPLASNSTLFVLVLLQGAQVSL